MFRQNIYDSWEGKCAYCGNKATSLDHVIPKYRGGKTVRSNLVPACCCNHHKGSEEWHQWFQRQQFWSPEKEERITAWMQEELTVLQWNELKTLVGCSEKNEEKLNDRLDDIYAA